MLKYARFMARLRQHSVLVIDDDEALLALIERFLRKRGLDVVTSNTALGVSQLMRSFRPDVVVLDQTMPTINGNRVADLIRNTFGPLTPIILHSGSDPHVVTRMADETANTAFVPKGEHLDRLYDAIRSALRMGSASAQ